MRQAFRLVSLFVILPWLISPQLVGAFEKNAHNALAGRAVSDSGLNSFLRDDLGIPGGTTAEILGQQIVEWVQNGSISEDSPRSRVLRHFHDPTRPWADAGLGGGSSSSVLWAQDQFQSASWQNARDRYSKSLTLRTRNRT